MMIMFRNKTHESNKYTTHYKLFDYYNHYTKMNINMIINAYMHTYALVFKLITFILYKTTPLNIVN